MEDSSFSRLLLLLMVCVCEVLEGTEALTPGGGAEDHGSRIRGLWRLHMKDTQSRGKGEGRRRRSTLYTWVCTGDARKTQGITCLLLLL